MSSPLKNKLYILGDSFAKWPWPKGQHWSNLMEKHYTVLNYGHGGSSFTETALQTTYIKNYNEGDRLVIVLTEAVRTPKNIRNLIRNQGLESESTIIGRLHLDRGAEFQHAVSCVSSSYDLRSNGDSELIESELLDFYFLINIKERYKSYKPIYVTWNEYTYDYCSPYIKDIVYIPLTDTTSLNDEGIVTENIDYHPGIEGNKVWYNRVLNMLNTGKTGNKVKPKKVGSLI